MASALSIATAAFIAADEAWQRELAHLFGRSACIARYDDTGMGEPGSELRRLYTARDEARLEFERARVRG